MRQPANRQNESERHRHVLFDSIDFFTSDIHENSGHSYTPMSITTLANWIAFCNLMETIGATACRLTAIECCQRIMKLY